MNKKKIIFLYTELAEYFVSCLRELAKNDKFDIYIFRWPVNKEAPFDFNIPQDVSLFTKNIDFNEADILDKVNEISPDVIFCSGWSDKSYVKVCKHFFGKIPTVLLMDNQWDGSLRKRLATIIGKITLHKIFSNAWVPGEPQYNYALKLGFNKSKVRKGFYSADLELFDRVRNNGVDIKTKTYPKVFLYVGRYVKHKGIFDLWQAFIEFQKESNSNWELWCIGTGDQYENRVLHDKIKHFGFVQPAEMEQYIIKSGCYVLPSHFEPWGVTIHEFAAAGLPIICSDKVGAATQFVRDSDNGYIFSSGSVKELKQSMYKVANKSDEELIQMSNRSYELSKFITPKKWVETLYSFVE